eukprot:m.19086 g.19086  ORF g.19086 m.19086 type:complete len:555 (+) comp27783_c0_seq2:201-1865(+)
MAEQHFTTADYVVFGLTTLASLAIGLGASRVGKKRETTSTEFLMADKSMKSIPIALSLLASFMSAITILGFPSEIYFYGVQYAVGVLAFFIAAPVVSSVFVPVFYRLDLTSAYEYLERRFSSRVRQVSSLVFLMQTLLYSAVAVYAPALALDAVTGFPVWTSILCSGLVATVYTALGGMKAVIWTDVFQAGVMLLGILSVILIGISHVGRLGTVLEISSKGHRLNFFNFSLNPTERLTFWSLTLGHLFSYLAVWGTSQTSVQRMLTAKTLEDAKKSVWLVLPFTLLTVTLCALSGLVIYAVYAKQQCDPVGAHLICKDDQILPYFVVDVLSGIPGLAGLFVSCIVSATLSTVSSNLNSMATISLEDFIKPQTDFLLDARATYLSRALAFGYGILVIVLAIGFSYLPNQRLISAAASVFGTTGGPLLGVFTLGMFSRKASSKGALVGLFSGLVLVAAICVGAELHPSPTWSKLAVPSTLGCQATGICPSLPVKGTDLYAEQPVWIFGISFMWYSAIGFLVTFAVGHLVSVFQPGKDSDAVESRLLAWQGKSRLII